MVRFVSTAKALDDLVAAARAWADHYDRGKKPAGSLTNQQRYMDEEQPILDALREAVRKVDA